MRKPFKTRSTVEQSLARVELFDDSHAISDLLMSEVDDIDGTAPRNMMLVYAMREAVEHIDEMWQLVQELRYHLKRLT